MYVDIKVVGMIWRYLVYCTFNYWQQCRVDFWWLWYVIPSNLHCCQQIVWWWLQLFLMVYTINRYVTKSKNCSGFMKVDQILKVWSLLCPKIFISPKYVVPKKTTGQIPAAPPVHNDPPQLFFLNPKFLESVKFFGKPAS